MKRIKIISFITAAVCLISSAHIPAIADDAYISISTAADLTALSKSCISDSYSVGKTFILENDLDLSGCDFDTIGSFGGTFDGRGHTIKNLTLSPVDSTRGFIGTVAETGVVKDLHLEGDISPKNEQKSSGISRITGILNEKSSSSLLQGVERYTSADGIKSIGGIAGENKGKIIGCTFSGSITGAESIGGIAGENAQNGRIEYCENYAVITADMNTGGIAGKNYGVIKLSTNNGLINPTANESAQNTGGIAGRSYGAVLQSVNRAEIGYKNAGYNVGGITGCQNGLIAECTNYGHIQGRKDIGGITGQFEPYTNIDFSQDEIQKRIDENIEQLKSDLKEADRHIVDRYDSLKSDIESIDDFLGISGRRSAISDAVTNVSDSLVDTNSRLSESISDTSGRLSEVGDRIADYSGDLSGRLGSSGERISDSLAGSSENLDSAVNDIVNILDDVSNSANDIKNDTSDATDRLIELLDTANSTLVDGSGNSEELINTLIDTLENADFDLSSMDVNVDMNMDDLSNSLRDLSRTLSKNLDDIADPFVRISNALGDILDTIADKNDSINNTIDSLQKILDNINSLPSVPAPPDNSLPSLTLPTQRPSDSNVIDSLKDIIGIIIGSLNTTACAAENDSSGSTAKALLELDIRDMDIKINRKTGGEIMDAALIRYCINEGTVDGMIDTGGIAGAVGFESSSNPEENFNISGSYSLSPSTAIKAVIDASVNEGSITAKNTSAGGIAGFADIGTVKQSMSRGAVEVTDGNYAGGIAGYSANNISKSISLSDISAKGFAGGIAGKGTNIDTCYALARINSDGEKLGAIAGLAEGNIRYNYFLEEELSGIDGVNYESKAQPEPDTVMASSDGKLSPELKGFDDKDWYVAAGDRYMPQLKAFTENDAERLSETLKLKSSDFARFHFKVRFLNNGKEIKSLIVNYGERIPEAEIPKLEKRGSTYGNWDKDITQKIVRDTDFNCVYEKSTTTIAYGSEPSVMLVEGNFRPGTILNVEESAASIADSSKYETDRLYSFTVTEDTGEYTDPVTVRVMEKSPEAVIGIVENGAVTLIESEVDGSYVKFEMAKPGEFVVLHKKPNILLPVIGGLSAAILAAVILIIYRKKKAVTTV